MSDNKPSIPKGTRDFSPTEMIKRIYIFDTIRKVFQRYGFLPIETPAMESLSTLLGKYGEEGDKLLFKIVDNGDYLNNKKLPFNCDFIYNFESDQKDKIKVDSWNDFAGITGTTTSELSGKLLPEITGKGLRYDLTVPFARYVVQYKNEIVFPFKRYQMQPVWRADRPQKGRYREFYQCDADVIGSNSLLNEVEIIQIIDEVFNVVNLNTRVLIKINNRKILSGVAEIIGEADKITDITVAIDKLDKIGLEKVNEELAHKGIPEDSIKKIQPIIKLKGSNSEKINDLRKVFADSETGIKGINEIEKVLEYVKILNINTDIEFDITLARGLNYYTGAIFEVKALEAEIGSICGGGRYDDLTGIFGLKDVSGVGISFGADRIYDVLLQLNRYPVDNRNTTKLLFVNFGETEENYCLSLIDKVRKSNINAELYPDHVKMKKQFDYANNREIPFVAIVGESEIAENKVVLKNMLSGEQTKLTIEELIKKISTQSD